MVEQTGGEGNRLGISNSQPTKDARPAKRAWSEMPVVTAVVAAVLVYAWLQRDEGHINAETGIGYYLGIVGSVLMLALLLYPLRKRFQKFRFIGGVRSWFRIHMLLGVIGPALVLLHSNFTLGSLNSSVALWAMLIVAGSGFAGRYFYGRIHQGLYGKKQNATSLAREIGELGTSITKNTENGANIGSELAQYGHARLGHIDSFWRSLFMTLTGPFSRQKFHTRIRRKVDAELKIAGVPAKIRRKNLAEFDGRMKTYFHTVSRAEALSLYGRLFSAWHLLHLPLFFILVLAALVHVLAVHLY